MAASVETYAALAIADFTSAGGDQDFTFDAGSGADRVLYVYLWMRTDRGHSAAITYDGVSLSPVGASAQNPLEGNTTAQLYRLIAPAAGSNTLRFSFGAGAGNAYANAHAVVVQDADQPAPNDTPVHEAESGADNATTQDVSTPSAVGDLVLTFAQFSTGGNDCTGSVAGASYTLLQQSQHGGTQSRIITGSAAGAATVTPSTTYNNGNPWGATRLAVSINPAGPPPDPPNDSGLGGAPFGPSSWVGKPTDAEPELGGFGEPLRDFIFGAAVVTGTGAATLADATGAASGTVAIAATGAGRVAALESWRMGLMSAAGEDAEGLGSRFGGSGAACATLCRLACPPRLPPSPAAARTAPACVAGCRHGSSECDPCCAASISPSRRCANRL